MIPAEEALRRVLDRVVQLESETVDLSSAHGRLLRRAALADEDSPRFDASAMDGYAARRADLAQPLRVVGEVQAGSFGQHPLGAGECVRIFTGAVVPPGADCVLKQEEVSREGDQVHALVVDGPSHIRQRGENRRQGQAVLAPGTRLGPTELAALATIGLVRPEVSRLVRCVHLATGNEIISPDRTPAGAQIRDSNSSLIAALLQRPGVAQIGHARVGDDPDAAYATAKMLPDHDVLLISGGASVGDHDFARPLLKLLGYEIHFDSLDLRPGRPLVFASRRGQYAFALPGNPVSHWVTFHLFVAPLLEKLQTGFDPAPARLLGRVAVGSKLPPPDKRRTYWPCHARVVNGVHELAPLPLASSGDGVGLTGANALLPLVANNLDLSQPVEFIPCP